LPGGLVIRPCPKPVKRVKEPKPLRAKRWGVSKSKRGTAHGRRERQWGRMMYYKTLPCDMRTTFALVFPFEFEGSRPGVCFGCIEVAHLGERAGWRRCPDRQTGPLCQRHHRDIDGRIGGRAPWYVALGREGQRALRGRLVARADLRWSTLTGNQRADWEARAMERAGL
jgi:hypothetical protein